MAFTKVFDEKDLVISFKNGDAETIKVYEEVYEYVDGKDIFDGKDIVEGKNFVTYFCNIEKNTVYMVYMHIPKKYYYIINHVYETGIKQGERNIRYKFTNFINELSLAKVVRMGV